jgi:hypothetical protein
MGMGFSITYNIHLPKAELEGEGGMAPMAPTTPVVDRNVGEEGIEEWFEWEGEWECMEWEWEWARDGDCAGEGGLYESSSPPPPCTKSSVFSGLFVLKSTSITLLNSSDPIWYKRHIFCR